MFIFGRNCNQCLGSVAIWLNVLFQLETNELFALAHETVECVHVGQRHGGGVLKAPMRWHRPQQLRLRAHHAAASAAAHQAHHALAAVVYITLTSLLCYLLRAKLGVRLN